MKALPLKALATLLLISLLISCASLTKNSYKTLVVSQTTYETSLEVAGDLYKQGKLPENVKKDVLLLANSYKQAHNHAVDALLKFKRSNSSNDEEAYLRAVSTASMLLAEILKLIQPYLEEAK